MKISCFWLLPFNFEYGILCITLLCTVMNAWSSYEHESDDSAYDNSDTSTLTTTITGHIHPSYLHYRSEAVGKRVAVRGWWSKLSGWTRTGADRNRTSVSSRILAPPAKLIHSHLQQNIFYIKLGDVLCGTLIPSSIIFHSVLKLPTCGVESFRNGFHLCSNTNNTWNQFSRYLSVDLFNVLWTIVSIEFFSLLVLFTLEDEKSFASGEIKKCSWGVIVIVLVC